MKRSLTIKKENGEAGEAEMFGQKNNESVQTTLDSWHLPKHCNTGKFKKNRETKERKVTTLRWTVPQSVKHQRDNA